MTDPKILTPAEVAEIKARAEKATAGPWCVETCGEKGDGSDMIGVAYGPADQNCDHPLSGTLDLFDAEGNEIEYYRDELVAECEHRNRNPHGDAIFIAASRADVPALCHTIEELRAGLRWFLDDPRFQVAVGGNPIAVDEMLAKARALLGDPT